MDAAASWEDEMHVCYAQSLPPEVPPTPSEPGRCKIIDVDHTHSTIRSLQTYYITLMKGGPYSVATKWQPSTKATVALSFLDLPKEIRENVYRIVCDDLHRAGLKWKPQVSQALQNHHRQRLEAHWPRQRAPPKSNVSSCTIMRSCRQIHSEFAETLYSMPLELDFRTCGADSIPITTAYAKLVKKIVIPFTYKSISKGEGGWAEVLKVSNLLSKLFPNTAVIRIAWYCNYWNMEGGEFFYGLDSGSRASQVKACETYVRDFKKVDGTMIPHQCEMLMIESECDIDIFEEVDWDDSLDVRFFDLPFSEAIRNLRCKPPSKEKT